ncbi:hypothetical protein ACPV5S_20125 [Vibrio astriarenae]
MDKTTISEIHRKTGFSRSYLTSLAKEVDGWDLDKGMAYCLARVVEHYRDGNSSKKIDYAYEKARLERAKADKVEREVKILDGDLVSKAEVSQEWDNSVAIVNQAFANLGASLGPVLASKMEAYQVTDIINDEVYRILDNLGTKS